MNGLQILTNLQKRILKLFCNLPDKDAFYLTGGTALSAFFLKHRKSHDLDFFTSVEELILPFSQKLELYLKQENLKKGFFSLWRKEIRKEITGKYE